MHCNVTSFHPCIEGWNIFCQQMLQLSFLSTAHYTTTTTTDVELHCNVINNTNDYVRGLNICRHLITIGSFITFFIFVYKVHIYIKNNKFMKYFGQYF